MFDSDVKSIPDEAKWEGEKDGFCEVIFIRNLSSDEAVVEPPQLHNVDYQGPIAVQAKDLTSI
jgi:hypothetical protein